MPELIKIIKNTRRIPTDYEFLSDPKVNLKVYYKLQLESKWNQEQREEHRYIYKNSINMRELSEEIGLTEKTFRKHFKYLIFRGYIEEIKDGRGKIVYLLKNDSPLYTLVPLDELELLCHSTSKVKEEKVDSNVVKIYTIIRSFTEISETYTCYLDRKELANRIGLSNKAKDNLDIITSCHNKLENMKLIESRKVTSVLKNGRVKVNKVTWCKYKNRLYQEVKEEMIPF